MGGGQTDKIRLYLSKNMEFVEISPKNKDKLLDKYKTGFEKDQKKYDELFEYGAKKVVHAQPCCRISKAVRLTRLPYGPLPKPEPLPSTYSVVMGSTWLYGFV